MRFPLGRDAKLYQSTDGTAYNINGQTKDVALALTKAEDDDTVRDNGGWASVAATLKTGGVEFTMLADGSEQRFTELQNSFFSDAVFRVKVMSGLATATTSYGLEAWMTVTNLSRSENLGEVQKYTVSLKIANPPAANVAQVPAWIQGAAAP